MKIASSSVQAMALSIGVLMVILMLCMAVFYIHKKNTAKIFLIGMLGYFIPQIIIRYPLLSWMQIAIFPFMNVYVVILLLSLSAAFMETLGRYLVIRFALKHKQTRLAGIIAGLGHGVCEALFLLGITYINNLFILYLAQIGTASTQINLVLTAVEQVPLDVFYLALLERCLFIIVQTGLSSFLMNGMLKKRNMIFVCTFLLHFILDAMITMLSHHGYDLYFINIIVFIWAGTAMLYMWKSEVWFPYQKIEAKALEQEVNESTAMMSKEI